MSLRLKGWRGMRVELCVRTTEGDLATLICWVEGAYTITRTRFCGVGQMKEHEPTQSISKFWAEAVGGDELDIDDSPRTTSIVQDDSL